MVAIDQNGRTIAKVHGDEGSVTIPDEALPLFFDPSNQIVVHHTHPNDLPFSIQDIAATGLPGVKSIWAYGHDGSVSRIELTPLGRELVHGSSPERNVANFKEVLEAIRGFFVPTLRNSKSQACSRKPITWFFFFFFFF